jgi:hypothetical protein
MRDQEIWKENIGDWAIVGYLEGYANGAGYGNEIVNRGFNRLDWTRGTSLEIMIRYLMPFENNVVKNMILKFFLKVNR